jgi:hypothetical protein
MSAPYIQGLLHDNEGRTVQFLIGPDGYRQWGWTGPSSNSGEAYARNVEILTALEEAANTHNFFEDPDAYQQQEQA